MATYAVTDPEKHFYLHGGGTLTSLEDLFTELQTMDPGVWQHHTEERNDFAAWVRDVMDDRFLARNIERCRTKDELTKLLFINFFR